MKIALKVVEALLVASAVVAFLYFAYMQLENGLLI